MNIVDIIQKKRDGKILTKDEISYFVDSYTKGETPDYQASAFLMASFILTESMLYSGDVVDLKSVKGIKVDKHSTGGVGDKPSLIIAPICAACGVPVPMISGRGLGHTGGTLDKLESIPGFNVNLDLKEYEDIIRDFGFCLIGQTKEIAPADKKIYSLRDVTGTVESISLISASIMSKKLAEGIDSLVLDVKTGSGAFMKSIDDSEALANSLVGIGQKMGKQVVALITNMNEPLGKYVGNALEVIESVDLLKGKCENGQEDLLDLSLTLAGHMIHLGGKAKDLAEGITMAKAVIADGTAFLKLKALVKRQSGDEKSLDDFSLLPTAKHTFLFKSEVSGYVNELDALSIGKASVLLGGGRLNLDTVIDPAVGIIVHKKTGDKIDVGETLLEIKYNSKEKLDQAMTFINSAYKIFDKSCSKPVVIIKTIGDVK
jgi:pyrimidine-nucleoside phosphorylase